MSELLGWLQGHKGYWEWDGHKNLALLTSGKVSDVYINFTQMYEMPNIMAYFASKLIFGAKLHLAGITHVIGPAYSGLQLAHEIARDIEAKVNWGEPLTRGVDKTMTFQRFDLPSKAKVLLVDDVVSTGSTIQQMAKTLALTNPFIEYYPTIFCLVNRLTGGLKLDTPKGQELGVRGLIHVKGEVWEKNQVPEYLRDTGVMRPKTCWNALTTEML